MDDDGRRRRREGGKEYTATRRQYSKYNARQRSTVQIPYQTASTPSSAPASPSCISPRLLLVVDVVVVAIVILVSKIFVASRLTTCVWLHDYRPQCLTCQLQQMH